MPLNFKVPIRLQESDWLFDCDLSTILYVISCISVYSMHCMLCMWWLRVCCCINQRYENRFTVNQRFSNGKTISVGYFQCHFTIHSFAFDYETVKSLNPFFFCKQNSFSINSMLFFRLIICISNVCNTMLTLLFAGNTAIISLSLLMIQIQIVEFFFLLINNLIIFPNDFLIDIELIDYLQFVEIIFSQTIKSIRRCYCNRCFVDFGQLFYCLPVLNCVNVVRIHSVKLTIKSDNLIGIYYQSI